MRAGNLYHRINFYAKVSDRDDYSAVVDTWPTITISTRGEIRYTGGSRSLASETKFYSRSMELIIRYRTDIEETMRVRIDGTSDRFIISAPIEEIGKQEGLRIMLEKITISHSSVSGFNEEFTFEGWYGVLIDKTSSSPDLHRDCMSGCTPLYRDLPVHRTMKACLLNDDGTVNYYLLPDDWSKKADESASDLSGPDGQVMIEVGPYYRCKVPYSENIDKIAVSLNPIDGFQYVPRFYVGAYKASINRTENKLASVVNNSSDYRGGNNNDSLDEEDETLLGKPVTGLNLPELRTAALGRGIAGEHKWGVIPWFQALLLYELFIIEYATINWQKPINEELTTFGMKQGGLGAGVTTVDSLDWENYNSYYPLIPCGISNTLANGSGEVDYDIPGFGVTGAVKVPRYRGIECPFGDIWEFCDSGTIIHGARGGGIEDQFDTDAFEHENVYEELFYPEAPMEAYYRYYTFNLFNDPWRAMIRGGSANWQWFSGMISLYFPANDTLHYSDLGARLCYIP